MLVLSSCVYAFGLLLLQSPSLGYHLGGNDTNCWKGPNYVALAPTCDGIADIHFTQSPVADVPLYINEPFGVVAELHPELDLMRKNGFLVPHANIHMCRAELGWCTPDVNVTQDLVTQSPPLQSDTLVLNVSSLMVAIPGQWSIVAHYSIVNEQGQWDVAAGFKRRFLQRKTRMNVDSWAVAVIYVLACIGLLSTIITAILLILARNHWVFRASSPNLSLAVISGCGISFVSVFTLSPPSLPILSPLDEDKPVPMTSSMQCNGRVWLLSLAFDFVLIPLALKTWRVSVLFDGTFKRVSITDVTLTRFALGLILADVTFCLIWTIGFPLSAGEVPTVSNPSSVYIIQCRGPNQLAFEMCSIVTHGLPLIWLAFVGRKVGSNFRKRSIKFNCSSAASTVQTESSERKLNQFNESEALSLTLAMLSCVSLFVVALQYTVTDSPTAQMLMVACGVIWSGFFILAVLFAPRFFDFVRFEKDGVTKRTSTTTPPGGFLRRYISGESSKRQSTSIEVLIMGAGGGSILNHPMAMHTPIATLLGVTRSHSDAEVPSDDQVVKINDTEARLRYPAASLSTTITNETTIGANPIADLALL